MDKERGTWTRHFARAVDDLSSSYKLANSLAEKIVRRVNKARAATYGCGGNSDAMCIKYIY